MDSLYLGSKFIGHDSSIFAVFPEEHDVFAISTERLTRYKHDDLYPIAAIEALLRYRSINPARVKNVHFGNSFRCQRNERYPVARYENMLAVREYYREKFLNQSGIVDEEARRLLPPEMQNVSPKSPQFRKFMLQQSQLASWHGAENNELLDAAIRRFLQQIFPNAAIQVSYYDHQLCHAMSSRFTTPFDSSLLFTIDGCGDDSFSKVYRAEGEKIEQIADCYHRYMNLGYGDQQWEEMGSPGGVYRYFTHLLGFQPDADEGKVEALAAFGRPDETMLSQLLSLFLLDREKTALRFDKEKAESALRIDRMQAALQSVGRENMAASVQTFLEKVMLDYVSMVVEKTGIRRLSLSGGVVANVIMNLEIFEKVTPHIHIIPAMGDDGTSQGAAILQLLNNGYRHSDLEWLKDLYMPYYGTSYSSEDVRQRLRPFEDRIKVQELGSDWPKVAAAFLAAGRIGSIFHGRMEWGPRALGNRSILADPRMPDVRERLNTNIKSRPKFQPFCPSLLAEEKDRMFDAAYMNKHMTCAFRMREEFARALPGAVHVDNTARAQFVEESDNPNYYRLLREFKNLTGYGCLINTSFNKHGRTIVETPEDAVTDFLDTDLSFLVIEGWLVERRF